MTSVVVDASVAVKWLVREDDSDKAIALASSWDGQGIRIAAPHLILAEVTNVLYRRVVQGQSTVREATHQIESLMTSGVELHGSTALSIRALQLARDLRQGAVYDSHYLALAEILDCDLWTADERFFRVVATSSSRVRRLSEVEATEL